MSYLKDTDSTSGVILFYFATDSLKNEVILRTTMRAKTMKTQDGKSLLDDYAMSEDEDSAFTLLLGYSVKNVFAEVRKLTAGVSNSVFVDTEQGGEVGEASGWSIVDNDAYNSNTIDLLDIYSKEAIVLFILKEWYKMMGVAEENARLDLEYREKLVSLGNMTLQMRLKTLT